MAWGYKFLLIHFRTGKYTRDSSRYFSHSHSIVLHLFSFMAMTINGWFCGCVWLSCTWNLTGPWGLCWSMVVRRFSEDVRLQLSANGDNAKTLTTWLYHWLHKLDSFWSGETQMLHHPWKDTKFPPADSLPPAGVLQSSCSVGPLLLVNFHASLDVGRRPTTRLQDPAAVAGAAVGGGT